METTLRYEESHFGLENMGRDENGWARVSADGGETCLPLPMTDDDFEELVKDVLAYREQAELSEDEMESLRLLLHMDEPQTPVKNDFPNLTHENLEAIATHMNDEAREAVHANLAPCHPGEFLTAYLERDPDFPVHQFTTE